MADIKSLINKALSVGAMRVYIDSEPLENVMTITLPPLEFTEIEQEKTTSSTNFTLYDPSSPDGSNNEGTIVTNSNSPQIKSYVDPTRLRQVKIVSTINTLVTSANQIVPIPEVIKMTVQFGKYERGDKKISQKEEQTLTFKMLNYTETWAGVETYKIDFLTGEYSSNGESLVSALAAIFA